jgi:hypothetical protein
MHNIILMAKDLFERDVAEGYNLAKSVLSEARIEDVAISIRAVARDPRLCARSERNPMLVKLCLAYDQESDVEVRLNYYYRELYEHDSWHDHKWNFFSRVLAGDVVHIASGTDAGNAERSFSVSHRAGDVFYIGSQLFHSFLPSHGTVTLMIRGPRSRSSWSRRELEAGGAQARSSDDLAAQHEKLDSFRCSEFAHIVGNALTQRRS